MSQTTNSNNSSKKDQRVIGFHYSLYDQQGSLVESSQGKTPLYFLEQAQQIIPGLEKEIAQMSKGDKKKITVAPGEAYGHIRQELIVTVDKKQLPNSEQVKVGDQFHVDNDPQAPVFMVKEIQEGKVILDGNHPMAGKSLTFDVEVMLIRQATSEELTHGHAHGESGEGHHH
jgi:FKBP-type peptidyl-prolyl cis-trans isomerase SlyD